MTEIAKEIIQKLNLQPHPEGGYFKEIYRSNEIIKHESLPTRFNGNRNFSTAIYFMLAENDKSHFHKINSDEIWHFYSGTTLILHLIDQNGSYSKIRVGNNFANEEQPQALVPNGVWFAAEVEDKNSYSLIGCTVSPGFDFSDFELAKRDDLLKMFPIHGNLIVEFTMRETA